MTTPIAPPDSPTRRFPLRAPGFWMALILIVYSFINVARALTNPADFAATFGTPLDAGSDAFVFVYAIRTLFIAAFGLSILARCRFEELAWYALIGLLMPAGDALLVAARGGPIATVARHIAVAAFLAASWLFLRRLARQTAR